MPSFPQCYDTRYDYPAEEEQFCMSDSEYDDCPGTACGPHMCCLEPDHDGSPHVCGACGHNFVD